MEEFPHGASHRHLSLGPHCCATAAWTERRWLTQPGGDVTSQVTQEGRVVCAGVFVAKEPEYWLKMNKL